MRSAVSNFRFLLTWIFGGALVTLGASALSLIIVLFLGGSGTVLSRWLPFTIGDPSAIFTVGLIVGGLVFGTLIGLLQKLLLRVYTSGTFPGWVLASMAAGAIALLVTSLLMGQPIYRALIEWRLPPKQVLLWYGLVPFLSVSLCFGIAQMLILTRYVHYAWLWVLSHLVGSLVLYTLLLMALRTVATTGIFAAPVPLLILALVVLTPHIVTGFTMVWLVSFQSRYRFPRDLDEY